MENKTINISQSLIKAYNDYLNENLCGIVFEKQYLTKEIESDPSEAMKLGHFFEYQATGALPRNGVEPKPVLLKDAKTMSVEYRRAAKQALNFQGYCKKLGITVLSTGKKIVKDGAEGTLDIIAGYKGKEVVIDLKYSGLLYDKWNDLGWDINALPYKEKIMIQSVHYTYLTDGMPFYFWVFSSTNEDDCELIHVNIDPDVIKAHPIIIEKTRGMIEIDMEMGFNPYPELVRCKKCPLFDECQYKVETPIIKEVFYTNQ
jgi:hypothetical protein